MFNYAEHILHGIEWFLDYIHNTWQNYTLWEFIISCIAAMVYVFLWPLGGMDIPLGTLIVTEVFDWITGMWSSHANGGWSSAKGREGMKKIVGFMMVIIMANLIDHLSHISAVMINFRFATVCFYISIEGKSVLENLKAIGIQSPSTLWHAIKALKDISKAQGSKDNTDDSIATRNRRSKKK